MTTRMDEGEGKRDGGLKKKNVFFLRLGDYESMLYMIAI